MATSPKKPATDGTVVIPPANLVRATVRIEARENTPLVQNAFNEKIKNQIMEGMATAKADKKGKSARPPRDYMADFAAALHVSTDGWYGVPCSAFRNAMIDACRTVDLPMTRAKMALFIIADGVDRGDGTPLTRLLVDEPKMFPAPVRNANGAVDIRIRGQWMTWAALVTLEFDADMISPASVVNLLDRAGNQVGIQEGRPFSPNSNGMNWGRFRVTTTNTEGAAA